MEGTNRQQPNKKFADRFRLYHWQKVRLLLMLFDLVAVNFAYGAALWLRFDGKFAAIPAEYLNAFLHFWWIYSIIAIGVFWFLRLYHAIWRFASFKELEHIVVANMITFVIQCLGITLLFKRMPISYYVFGGAIQFVLTAGIRFFYRFLNLIRDRYRGKEKTKNVMIIGAGAAGQVISREMSNTSLLDEKLCCFIDDNPNKWGRYIDNVIVAGGREDILHVCAEKNINKIIFAIPSATTEERRDILQICLEANCEIKQLPGMYRYLGTEFRLDALKNVTEEELLGRAPIRADMDEVFDYIHGKTVLVTGGGGSIGSELCRQVAAHQPKRLIIFDIYENNAYAIQLELKEKYPSLDLVVLIGSVRDSLRVNGVFAQYRPDVVYHAAAHKHVPLMEDSPCEAIKNNVFGTYKCCHAALRYGCRIFVLISTDKAVNPTNMMGASKRLCEMVVQTFDYLMRNQRTGELPLFHAHKYDDVNVDMPFGAEGNLAEPCTRFSAVRFGNVLGSNGSVVPLFKKQIAKGGPVTVTHPDIIRYFMTIPEAVSLVLLAGTYAKSGEIFVLDMGSPVKIDTLARNLIRLAGLKPYVDIKIEYTGLRPGEKLYEEKLMAEEGLEKTANKLIFIGKPLEFNHHRFMEKLKTLDRLAYRNDEAGVFSLVKEMVVTYHPETKA